MAFYSEDVIQQLKAHADIASVIEHFLPLKPTSGGRFLCRCPFHDDSKPSMNINPQMGIYKCFACGAGGDVFKFVMEHEKVDFKSAVEWIANETGFALPKLNEHGGANTEQLEERGLVKELNDLAASWFESELLKSEETLAYLNKRGITEETRKKFRFGYAPEGREGFLSFAAKKGYSPRQLVTAGLAVERENGGISDKFRGRLMIPIQNMSGMIVAFGGRILKDLPNAPKYMNSADTPIYKKGDILFGMYQARQAIAKAGKVIIVEGYFDLISLYQAGIQNVIAASGTALTEKHAEILARYVQTAYLVFDGDAAGKKATRRSIDIVLAKSITPRIFSLSRPNGEKIDPDNFINERGGDAFLDELKNAEDWLDYLIHEDKPNSPEERAGFVRSAKEIISKIPDGELARQYLQLLSERFGTAASLQGIKQPQKTVRVPRREQLPEESEYIPEQPVVQWQTLPPIELRYVNLVIRNSMVLRAAAMFYDMQLVTSGVTLLEAPMLDELLSTVLVYYREHGELNLKLFISTISPELQEILINLPVEKWDDASANKEFLEMTLDLERRFAERLRNRVEDIDFKMELTVFCSTAKRQLIDAKKGKLFQNDLLKIISANRQVLANYNMTIGS